MLQIITDEEKVIAIYETDKNIRKEYFDFLKTKAKEINIDVSNIYPTIVHHSECMKWSEYKSQVKKWVNYLNQNTICDFAERELGLVKKEFKLI